MNDNFPASLKAVLRDEGGNDDDPSDHGGRTSRGITQREYTAWLAEHAFDTLRNSDVWKATDQDIAEIYHDEYWEPFCDIFPIGLDYLYFDMAVNAGPYRATCLLQRALDVTEDGRIGPITRAAIQAADPKTIIDAYTKTKRAFYLGLAQPKFTKGWLNRCVHVQQIATAMAQGQA